MSLPIPKLYHNVNVALPLKEEYYSGDAERLAAVEDFLQGLPACEEDSIDPLAEHYKKERTTVEYIDYEPFQYDVDDEPLPEEDGVLRLKMPLVRQPAVIGKPYFANTRTVPGLKSVHLGYNQSTEEEAFANPLSAYSLSALTFSMPREQYPIGQIIDNIRTVVFNTSEVNEIAPKIADVVGMPCLYSTMLVYTTFDDYFNHRFARLRIRLCVTVLNGEKVLAVSAYHVEGDGRITMAIFNTIQEHVLSGGKKHPEVKRPNFNEGFSDDYE